MPAPQEVIKLIENFEGNLEAYRGGKYNETQVRREQVTVSRTGHGVRSCLLPSPYVTG